VSASRNLVVASKVEEPVARILKCGNASAPIFNNRLGTGSGCTSSKTTNRFFNERRIALDHASARLCSAGRSSETPSPAGFGPAPSCPPAAARSARRWGVPPACGQPCLQKGRSIMQADFTFRRLFVGSECPRRSWRGAPRNRSGMPSRLERSLDSCAFHDEPRPPGSARVECPVVPRWNRSKTVVRVWQDPTRPQGTRQRLRAWPASDG
jgi:hypothetical protein